LLAQYIKAKYYPHNDILQANLGDRPSYTWYSIFHAKWVIKKWGCWKIGNGNNVKIWEDNWLPE